MHTAHPTRLLPHLQPHNLRISFFREQWEQIATKVAGRPIALYGAGRHTRFLLRSVQGCTHAPEVAFILDDAPEGRKEINGIPVCHPRDVSPSQVALVLVSSDMFEELLAERALAWTAGARVRPGTPVPPVQRLYGDEQLERLGTNSLKLMNAWGNCTQTKSDHLPASSASPVLHLSRVVRPATTALPVPPSELRAGYNVLSELEYVESGRSDVAAMRNFIACHAPQAGPQTRVLDWGCSTGRMIRHWTDVADAGGEVWGCDICATSIHWASENLPSCLGFFTSTTRPHLPLPDASMDLIYGNSVFTHIRELWDAWLMELRRIVRPGGLVHTTILDETSWEECAQDTKNQVRARCDGLNFAEPLADDMVSHGSELDIYTFWHSQGVRKRWSPFFDVLAIEQNTDRFQSAVLLQRRG